MGTRGRNPLFVAAVFSLIFLCLGFVIGWYLSGTSESALSGMSVLPPSPTLPDSNGAQWFSVGNTYVSQSRTYISDFWIRNRLIQYNAPNPSCTAAARWAGSSWEVYDRTLGTPNTNNFPLEMGRGYLLRCTSQVNGPMLPNISSNFDYYNFNYTFPPGYTFMSPVCESEQLRSAAAFYSHIIQKTGVTCSIATLSRSSSGYAWNFYDPSIPSTNFTMNRSTAFLVYCPQQVKVTNACETRLDFGFTSLTPRFKNPQEYFMAATIQNQGTVDFSGSLRVSMTDLTLYRSIFLPSDIRVAAKSTTEVVMPQPFPCKGVVSYPMHTMNGRLDENYLIPEISEQNNQMNVTVNCIKPTYFPQLNLSKVIASSMVSSSNGNAQVNITYRYDYYGSKSGSPSFKNRVVWGDGTFTDYIPKVGITDGTIVTDIVFHKYDLGKAYKISVQLDVDNTIHEIFENTSSDEWVKNKTITVAIPMSAVQLTSKTYDVPVLVLAYIPVTGNNRIDRSYGDAGDIPEADNDVVVLQNRISSITALGIDALTKGSAYHGYKDPKGAVPSLRYGIKDKKTFFRHVPESSPSADHVVILQQDVDICDYVENKGVKEVWIWMYHNDRVAPIESYQVSPTGSFGNAEIISPLPPVCKKSYTIYNYNYGRELGEFMENHMHHVEFVMKHIEHPKYLGWLNNARLFDSLFVGFPCGSTNPVAFQRCGWTHSPPNMFATCDESYNWFSEVNVTSDCEDWSPDGTRQKKQVNCHTWEHVFPTASSEDDAVPTNYSPPAVCSYEANVGFKVWWMQNLPGKDNALYYQGKKVRNWWDYIGDYDQATSPSVQPNTCLVCDYS